MTKKTFYRVGKEDGSGLWYDTNGNYHGSGDVILGSHVKYWE